MERSQEFVFEAPKVGDREAMARMLAADMAELGVDQGEEALLGLAELVIADGGRSSFCRVVRPGAGGEAVGLVLANVCFSVKFAGRALWIENLYVDRAWRRYGLGRALVERMLDWAELNGIRGIDLEAYQGNTPAALLYRSLGFERLGRERFWFDFRWVEQGGSAGEA